MSHPVTDPIYQSGAGDEEASAKTTEILKTTETKGAADDGRRIELVRDSINLKNIQSIFILFFWSSTIASSIIYPFFIICCAKMDRRMS